MCFFSTFFNVNNRGNICDSLFIVLQLKHEWSMEVSLYARFFTKNIQVGVFVETYFIIYFLYAYEYNLQFKFSTLFTTFSSPSFSILSSIDGSLDSPLINMILLSDFYSPSVSIMPLNLVTHLKVRSLHFLNMKSKGKPSGHCLTVEEFVEH